VHGSNTQVHVLIRQVWISAGHAKERLTATNMQQHKGTALMSDKRQQAYSSAWQQAGDNNKREGG